MIENRQLTDNFSLYELTKTIHYDLQNQNREITDAQAYKLFKVAELHEALRFVLNVPLIISSGYRCPELNARVGSTPRSQHLLCEAADSIPKGIPVDEAFHKLRNAAKANKFQFGQLIYEKSEREGLKEWLHASLGFPYRKQERCGQILTMVDGVYTLIETIPQGG